MLAIIMEVVQIRCWSLVTISPEEEVFEDVNHVTHEKNICGLTQYVDQHDDFLILEVNTAWLYILLKTRKNVSWIDWLRVGTDSLFRFSMVIMRDNVWDKSSMILFIITCLTIDIKGFHYHLKSMQSLPMRAIGNVYINTALVDYVGITLKLLNISYLVMVSEPVI